MYLYKIKSNYYELIKSHIKSIIKPGVKAIQMFISEMN